jgi:hypothetical protein
MDVLYTTHVDGTWWYEAPLPRRWHRCRPHTSALVTTGGQALHIDRCACGAMRSGSGPWADRNQRRRK